MFISSIKTADELVTNLNNINNNQKNILKIDNENSQIKEKIIFKKLFLKMEIL